MTTQEMPQPSDVQASVRQRYGQIAAAVLVGGLKSWIASAKIVAHKPAR